MTPKKCHLHLELWWQNLRLLFASLIVLLIVLLIELLIELLIVSMIVLMTE